MATDLERLVVQLSVDIKSYERSLRAAGVATGKQTQSITNQFNKMNQNVLRSFDKLGTSISRALGRQITTPLTAIGGALAIKEVADYADAWTLAGNKIAAAGAIAGRQGRSLDEINVIARRTRGGLVETADLYAGILRATGRVAKSEAEVAQVTETVIKAFKAGGAAASEQSAGILQLRQALGSGFLQGDELRSVRENATVLAQAIADEFGTTLAGLKALGAAGVVTSDRVFKAILEGKGKIDAAFAKTQSTIGEAFTQVENAFIQYIGHANQAGSVSAKLVKVLNELADNFGTVADSVLLVSGLVAGGLLGRAFTAGISSSILGLATLTKALRGVRVAAAGAGVAGEAATLVGPISAAIGVASVALFTLAEHERAAIEEAGSLRDEMRQLGLLSSDTGVKVDELGNKVLNLAPEEARLKLEQINKELERMRGLSRLNVLDALFGHRDTDTPKDIANAVREIQSLGTTGSALLGKPLTIIEKDTLVKIQALADSLNEGTIDAEEVKRQMDIIANTPVDGPINELIISLRNAIEVMKALGKLSDSVKGNLEKFKVGTFPVDPRIALNEQQQNRAAALAQRDINLAKTDAEKAIEKRTAEILKEVDGIAPAVAKVRAALEIAAEEEKKAREDAIKDFIKDQKDLRDKAIADQEEQRKAGTGDATEPLKDSATDLTQSSDQLDGSASQLGQAASALGAAAGQLSAVPTQISSGLGDVGVSITDSLTTNLHGLLDLISRAEGTAQARGFNETVGFGALTGGPVNLINMTLREILALQQRMLADPRNRQMFGEPTSAVGAFQIVSTTLKKLIDQLGLSLDTKFDPATQVKLATELIRQASAASGGNDAKFIELMRGQWEGLKKVSGDAILAARDAVTAQQSNTQSIKQSSAARRQTDAEIAAEAASLAKQLEALGVKADSTALSLAKVLGPESAAQILKAPPQAQVSSILTPEQAAPLAPLGPGLTAEGLISLANAAGGLSGELARINAETQKLFEGGQKTQLSFEQEKNIMEADAFTAAKLRAEYDLLNEARAKGIPITDKLRADIEAQATSIAKASFAVDQLKASQDAAAKSAKDLAAANKQVAEMGQQLESAFSGALKGFISDLLHGKSLTDALRDALTNLAEQLINLAIDSLFKNLFATAATGATGGGLLAGLFHAGGIAGAAGSARLVSPAAFAGAKRYHSGGLPGVASGEVAAILKKGEVVLPDINALRAVSKSGSQGGRAIVQNNTFVAQTGPILEKSRNQMARASFADINRASRVM